MSCSASPGGLLNPSLGKPILENKEALAEINFARLPKLTQVREKGVLKKERVGGVKRPMNSSWGHCTLIS